MSVHSNPLNEKQKLRTFSPVILFHDHQYVQAGSGDLQHVHIPYGDPSYGRHLDVHKKRIQEMLQTNGRYWLDIITWTRDHPESLDHSPVPSLVSSPSPPHYAYHGNHVKSTNDSRKLSGSTSHTVTSTSSSSTSNPTTSTTTSTTSTSNNKRRRGNLPKAVTAILRDWLSRHKKHPYPTEEEKAALAAETNLNLNQISNWFINARRRILQPMLEQEEEEEVVNGEDKNELDIIMPYDNRLHHHHHHHHLDDVYGDRRLRKRSASDVLAPTKYPPQKRMTHHHPSLAHPSSSTSTRRR
ncbi:unnamed protein product [Mucor hiemalis]